eukprot:CAMPEP_0114983064 /NCGR_PEP_ID=MMETSP0216-20121206/6482_1 /TAXON_ID=223996 /ORGANISM="Protocruzia adherens, Strain Boccale" /LENGTH=529 /DNA_ID=CAMNT_0002344985 /DNA_START=161 /DNA_END=1750 /DNA_ORIENTATION=-
MPIMMAESCRYDETGKKIVICNLEKVLVYELEEDRLLTTIEETGIVALDFSPGEGRYVVGLKKIPLKDKASDIPNIYVWDALTGEKVFDFVDRKINSSNWPALSWTRNEDGFFRKINDHLFYFSITEPQEKPIAVKSDRLVNFALSRTTPAMVGVLTLGKEERIDLKIYEHHPTEGFPFRRHYFFDKTQEAKLVWNPKGKCVLIWAQSSVDKTGRSYYGEHELHFAKISEQRFKHVPTAEGPIYDVKWEPNGKHFIITSGFMPARTVMFNSDCEPVFEFGQHHRNTIRWNPFSRFLMIGGFGNLPGEMDFWDMTTKEKIGVGKASTAVSIEWGPDGRHLLTATLNPRMRVNNGYKIFKYTGELLRETKVPDTEELYEVKWRPAAVDIYKDQPQSPRSEEERKKSKETAAPAKKLFRPPSSKFAEMLRASRQQEDTGPRTLSARDHEHNPGKSGRGGKGQGQNNKHNNNTNTDNDQKNIPGLSVEESKTVSKNAKRRAKKKKKQQQNEDGEAATTSTTTATNEKTADALD